MWFTVSFGVVLLLLGAFLAYLSLEKNPAKTHDLLIAGAAICGAMAIFTLAGVAIAMYVEMANAAMVLKASK